jgi:hypothetical protein
VRRALIAGPPFSAAVFSSAESVPVVPVTGAVVARVDRVVVRAVVARAVVARAVVARAVVAGSVVAALVARRRVTGCAVAATLGSFGAAVGVGRRRAVGRVVVGAAAASAVGSAARGRRVGVAEPSDVTTRASARRRVGAVVVVADRARVDGFVVVAARARVDGFVVVAAPARVDGFVVVADRARVAGLSTTAARLDLVVAGFVAGALGSSLTATRFVRLDGFLVAAAGF